MTFQKHIIILSLAVLLTACREPMSVEKFVQGEGPYTFFVDMSDSTASYDFDFYTRIDTPVDSLSGVPALPLEVVWTSPSFQAFKEEVYMPLEGHSSYFSRQVRVPYRTVVRPGEWGTWTLTVRVTEPLKGLRGMGLVVERKKEDGTR